MATLRNTFISISALALFWALALAGGCGKSDDASSGGGASSAATAEAQQLFATRCTPCHGNEGRGDGPASASLNPRPRDFQDGSWQSSVNDQHIERVIQFGGAAVGKSPAMPANPDLQSKPEVVAALRQHIRTLGN